MRVQHSVNESELPRFFQGEPVCEFCGAVMVPWSPMDGVTWYTCDWCGAEVVGLADWPAPEPVEEQVRW